jgi:benzylsuccinate CoA-transferase BbsF subunit
MDHQAGLAAAVVTMALLEERESTGVGAYADVSAREVASMMVGESILQALRTGVAPRIGNDHEVWAPHGVYPARGEDRWIAIAITSNDEWCALVDHLGVAELRQDSWSTETGRHAGRSRIDGILSRWTRDRDAGTTAAQLQAVGVCAEISMSGVDLVSDAHLLERRSIIRLEHPEHGERVTVQAPWRFSSSIAGYDQWSPTLGEANEEVICGLLGHTQAELDEWIASQVVY